MKKRLIVGIGVVLALLMGSVVATAVTKREGAGTADGRVIVLSEADLGQTSATTFETLATTNVVVPGGWGSGALLVMRFSGVVKCWLSAAPSDGDECVVRTLVDGQPTQPPPINGYLLLRESESQKNDGGVMYQSYQTVSPGTHSIEVQWRVRDQDPVGDGTVFAVDDWTLTIEKLRR